MMKICYSDLKGQSQFFLDYINGGEKAQQFFSHNPLDIKGSVKRTYNCDYRNLSKILYDYNYSIGAHRHVLENAKKLEKGNVFTVISGQQAGLLGGPLYTVYKIATTINLCSHLKNLFPEKEFIPIFWLASDDHDFNEINHVYLLKDDGETGKLSFKWNGIGRSVYDLPVTTEIIHLTHKYLSHFYTHHNEELHDLIINTMDENNYAKWTAKILGTVFGKYGLVIIEPRFLRPLAGDINMEFLKNQEKIRILLGDTKKELIKSGYSPPIYENTVGLFTYDDNLMRIKVENPSPYINIARERPEIFSPDALLRPIWADSIFPNIISVLGPGEICYHGQIKKLYEYFGIYQPLIFPRQSYTFISPGEEKIMKKYGIKIEDIFRKKINYDEILGQLITEDEKEEFRKAEEGLYREMEELMPLMERTEPNLIRTWQGCKNKISKGIKKLKDKYIKASLSRRGYYKKDVKHLINSILPGGKLQERVFPLQHMVSIYGIKTFTEFLTKNTDIIDFRHNIMSGGLL